MAYMLLLFVHAVVIHVVDVTYASVVSCIALPLVLVFLLGKVGPRVRVLVQKWCFSDTPLFYYGNQYNIVSHVYC